ncbi:fatty acid-binding protein-like [Culicoides brevitarsis]|uniref:fatty acid-binding protein-like n=1 Tax=Culicoides brevitarsis TaxID=469753 RepID=UPI00307C1293
MSSPIWAGKKYKLEKSENFEEFLVALGVGYLLRKLGNSVVPVIEMIQDGDYYVLKQSTTIRNVEIRFKPNEEFIEQTPDGRKTRTVITFETENVLIQRQLDGKPVTIVREFGEEELIMTLTVDDVKCKRYYRVLS